MPNKHDIFRNKRDFAREEFATELYKPKGTPKNREYKTKPGQQGSMHSRQSRED